jgi:hypothetical protein
MKWNGGFEKPLIPYMNRKASASGGCKVQVLSYE